MQKNYMIAFGLTFAMLLSGCAGDLDLSQVSEEDIAKLDTLIICEEPYMRFASGCCLDQNSNNICDEDETGNDISKEIDSMVENVVEETTAETTVIEMITYIDYQDPFSKKFFNEAFQEIKKNYIDTGKITHSFGNFPLSSIHPRANELAVASICVDKDARKLYEFQMFLFAQNSIDKMTTESLISLAVQDDAEYKKVLNCYDAKKNGKIEEPDQKISGTPTSFINEERIVGAQPYSVFEEKIEAALKN